jgi:predicted MFS family arabinose efflux permease
MFAFGLFLLLVKGLPVVPLFIAAYILFAVGIGVTYPVWQNFLVSIFSPQKSVRGLAVMMITQIAARIVGSLLIMESVSRYAFSLRGASVMFMLTGVVFFAGAFFFMPVCEIPDPEHENRERHTARTMARAAREILRNRQFMLYMLSMSEMYATVTVIAFYAPYAVRYAGISAPHAAGLFMTCVYAGAITGNVLLGWYNLGSLRVKFVAGKIAVLAAIGLMLTAQSLPAFLVISFLLGIARSVAQLAQAPAVKLLSGKKDATDYFSIAPVFLLPVSFGLPWGSGRLLDLYAASGQLVWQLTFAGLAVVVLLSILALLAVDFNRAEVHVR